MKMTKTIDYANRPRFLVIWGCNGDNVSHFWTDYHAAQHLRALTLNNTPCRLEVLP